MAKHVQFDEIRLIVRVPRDLDELACEAIRRVLESRGFRSSLRRAVRRVFQRHPELEPVRLTVSG